MFYKYLLFFTVVNFHWIGAHWLLGRGVGCTTRDSFWWRIEKQKKIEKKTKNSFALSLLMGKDSKWKVNGEQKQHSVIIVTNFRWEHNFFLKDFSSIVNWIPNANALLWRGWLVCNVVESCFHVSSMFLVTVFLQCCL